MAVQNKEYLQELTKEMPIFKGQKESRLMWDVSGEEAGNALKSHVSEFATNEAFKPLYAKAAWAYNDPAQGYIADQVAPFFPVTSLSGQYRAFDERMFFDRPNTNTGKDTRPDRVTYGSSLSTYTLGGRALAMYLSNVDRDEAINQYGSSAEWKRICTLFLTRLLLLDRELTVAGIYQDTTNFASGFTATSSPIWSNASATQQDDIMTAEDALMSPRDTLVIGYNVYRECQKHANITGATTVSGPARPNLTPHVNKQAIENYFDSPVVVGKGRYNSTPGEATPTMSRIWLNDVIIAHLAQDPGGPELSAPFCRTFKLRSASFPNVEGWSVKTVQDGMSSLAGGEVLMVGYFAEEKIFAQKSGYHLTALT